MPVNQKIRDLILDAWADDHVCLLGTVGKDGPNISPKGSLVVFDDDHLAYWERSKRKAMENLASDPRVVVMEKTNARFLKPDNFPAAPDLVVVDCSFISLKKILPPAVPLLKVHGKIVVLIKPQFEAGKAEADRGRGVITDAAIHDRVLAELEEFVSAQTGLCWRGVIESPLLGPAGNKEFLALIEKVR